MSFSKAPDTIFDRCYPITFQQEGNDALSLDPDDAGNWTGGECGKGVLRGTRWGFSAAAYPDLDIQNLTKEHAIGLAFANIWLPARCSTMAGPLAVLMFDAAFQHGVGNAVKMLQRTIGAAADGDYGAKTILAFQDAVANRAIGDLCVEFQSQRLLHMVSQPTWLRDAGDFSRRLCALMAASAMFQGASS